MNRCVRKSGGVLLAAAFFAAAGAAQAPALRPTPELLPRPAPRVTPKFEAVAETRLLMDGLAQANYRGLEKLLKERPADAETWGFVRGQALLIAETGNLLLLRPPRNQPAQDAWFERAMALRDAAGALARQAGARDYDASRTALAGLAAACNRCHQAFRVTTRIGKGADEERR